uniref:Kinase n=1 Tax=Macrostomum lignano TaxID=282301 RepID=A0A1I8HUE6_9PLAT
LSSELRSLKPRHHRTNQSTVTMATEEAWTQLSGHAGNFQSGSRPGRVMKRLCQAEADCLQALASDPRLRDFAPAFYGIRRSPSDDSDSGAARKMQDLLAEFQAPVSLMDCKIGCRTYLEDELAMARRDAKPRPDMYRRIVETDPDATTPEQRAAGAVTKLDYMLWRERLSSTSSLAFRIDGLKRGDPDGSVAPPPFDDFKRLRRREDILAMLAYFVDGVQAGGVARAYLERLRRLREALTQSEFFPKHELIGSSLLFVHDRRRARLRVDDRLRQDAAKSQPAEPHCRVVGGQSRGRLPDWPGQHYPPIPAA